MDHTNAKQIATTCLASWIEGDFDGTRALLDDDVTFVGPLAAMRGADKYIDGVRGMSEIVDDVEILDVICEGDRVSIRYDLITHTAGVIPTVGWYDVADGKIVFVRAFFDARPLVARGAGEDGR